MDIQQEKQDVTEFTERIKQLDADERKTVLGILIGMNLRKEMEANPKDGNVA